MRPRESLVNSVIEIMSQCGNGLDANEAAVKIIEKVRGKKYKRPSRIKVRRPNIPAQEGAAT